MIFWQLLLLVIGIIVLLVIVANLFSNNLEPIETFKNKISNFRKQDIKEPDNTIDLLEMTEMTDTINLTEVIDNSKYTTDAKEISVSEIIGKGREKDLVDLSELSELTEISSDSATDTISSGSELVERIKEEFMNSQYVFNIAMRPVDVKHLRRNPSLSRTYSKYIRHNIDEWRQRMKISKSMFKILEIRPLTVQDTGDEFELDAIVKLTYQNRTIHLRLRYYGTMDREIDFTDIRPPFQLQLVNIHPIDVRDYQSNIKTYQKDPEPFITMEEQLAYVAKINHMHENE